MKPTASIGYAVLRLRDIRGWTLEELGERCGLSASFLSDIEHHRAYPSLKSIQAIAGAFKLEAAIYFYKQGKPERGTIVLIGDVEHERNHSA